jgi:hypothetical protein
MTYYLYKIQYNAVRVRNHVHQMRTVFVILTRYSNAMHCEQVNEELVDSDNDIAIPVTSTSKTPSRQSTTAATKVSSKDKRGRKMSLERDLIDPLARRKRDVSPIA